LQDRREVLTATSKCFDSQSTDALSTRVNADEAVLPKEPLEERA
jgi:hypothetical protein